MTVSVCAGLGLTSGRWLLRGRIEHAHAEDSGDSLDGDILADHRPIGGEVGWCGCSQVVALGDTGTRNLPDDLLDRRTQRVNVKRLGESDTHSAWWRKEARRYEASQQAGGVINHRQGGSSVRVGSN